MAEVFIWLIGLLALALALLVDLKFFARGREPSFRESAAWSVGWLVLGLSAALLVWAVAGDRSDAVTYLTVYLIERSLSLDNLFVFLMLFGYFVIPSALRARLLFWGIVLALLLRGVAIYGGVTLLNQFSFVIYILAGLLLLLAFRMMSGTDHHVVEEKNLTIRVVHRFFPVSEELHGNRWFLQLDGRRHATPLFVCLAAFVFADIAFAVDSIPAAFAVTREPLLIWTANVFALLGMRALFVLVESLSGKLRYFDETIGVVLAVVAVKLLVEHWVHIGPATSLAIVLSLLAGGLAISLWADRLDRSSKPA